MRSKEPSREWLYQKYVVEELSIKTIAKLQGCSFRRIQGLIKDMGITRSLSEAMGLSARRKRGPSVLDSFEELRRLYIDETLPLRKIAKIAGTDTKAARNYLQKYSIPIRGPREAWQTPYTQRKVRGPAHQNWQGGISSKYGFQRAPGFTRELRKKIRDRDGNHCVRCGAGRKLLRALSVHHVDFDKNNHQEDNLVTLCRSCHAIVHAHQIHLKLEAPK